MSNTHVVRRCTSEEQVKAALDEQHKQGRRPITLDANNTGVWIVFGGRHNETKMEHVAARCTSPDHLERWLNEQAADGYRLQSFLVNDTVAWAMAKREVRDDVA